MLWIQCVFSSKFQNKIFIEAFIARVTWSWSGSQVDLYFSMCKYAQLEERLQVRNFTLKHSIVRISKWKRLKEYFEDQNGRTVNLHTFCKFAEPLSLAYTAKFTGSAAFQPHGLFLSVYRDRAIWEQEEHAVLVGARDTPPWWKHLWNIDLIEQVGSNRNFSDLYSECVVFVSRSEHRPFWQRISWFSSVPRAGGRILPLFSLGLLLSTSQFIVRELP
jgi:hypothetical protein